MLTILAPLLVFGLVVFVHELGHFLAAKAVGVYAPRFSGGECSATKMAAPPYSPPRARPCSSRSAISRIGASTPSVP